MYILKIKGKAKIPDYVQVRDSNFTLVAYFRADRPEKGLQECGFGDRVEAAKAFIDQLPYSKVTEFVL